jgi:CheY-like chemotaxis protein
MPIMNGPLAAKAMRDMHVDIPIIGVTGNVLPEDVAYFKGMGADIVLSKPVVAGQIFKEIERLVHLKKKQGRKAIRSDPSDFVNGAVDKV